MNILVCTTENFDDFELYKTNLTEILSNPPPEGQMHRIIACGYNRYYSLVKKFNLYGDIKVKTNSLSINEINSFINSSSPDALIIFKNIQDSYFFEDIYNFCVDKNIDSFVYE